MVSVNTALEIDQFAVFVGKIGNGAVFGTGGASDFAMPITQRTAASRDASLLAKLPAHHLPSVAVQARRCPFPQIS